MPYVSTSRTRAQRYDAIVVGSGAAGGMAAYALTQAGARVLMLEAGRQYDPVGEVPMFQSHADAPLRGVGTPEKPGGFFQSNIGGWVVPGEPYVVRHRESNRWIEAQVDNRVTTNQNFMWWRARMLGGRTNHWGRVSLRMGPRDFKPRSHDGLGVDWPISYEDVAPYYDRVDQLIGIFGTREGMPENPDSDYFQPPPKPRAYELLMQRGAERLGLRSIPSRMAILTRPLHGRPPCFYATPCSRGCAIRATFQSSTVLIPPALETGNLDIITDAMARNITIDDEGRATGVHFIDKSTGREEHAAGRTIILGASTCETTRILFNSRSNRFPDGLGASSGHLGRWLTDSTGSSLRGRLPALENIPLHNEDGVSVYHSYVPWTTERQSAAARVGVPRGYYIGWGGGRMMPSMGTADLILGMAGNAYGRRLKEEARRYFGSFVSVHARGETIPNERSFCELDPTRTDRWGIPVLRFHFHWSEHEVRQVAHQQQTFAEIIEAAGGIVTGAPALNGSDAMTTGGSVNHELGATRMSARPADGVTNAFGQLWDCPNVVVADGGVFASGPHKNPTITIMALAWRACDHLVEAMLRRDLSTPV